jgi:hypothetical protein
MEIPGPAWRAGGTIAPSTAVKIDVTADNQVVQAGAGDKCIGISQEGQKGAPGLIGSDTTIAAQAGDSIQVIGPCRVALAQLSGTVTRGDRLASDGSGNLVTFDPATATSPEYVGYALQSGVSGNLIDILVLPGSQGPDTGGPAADVAALTAATGTASSTISDAGGSFSQTTLNNNFKSLATTINAILANLKAVGLMS